MIALHSAPPHNTLPSDAEGCASICPRDVSSKRAAIINLEPTPNPAQAGTHALLEAADPHTTARTPDPEMRNVARD
jgi:hypothetical protein